MFLRSFLTQRATAAHDLRWARCGLGRPCDGHLVLLIDLDECAVLGRDTNDILRLIAGSAGSLREADQLHLLLAGAYLANPCLKDAFTALQSLSALPVEIVFYTQKWAVVGKLRACAGPGYRVPYIEPSESGTVYLEAGPLAETYQYLSNQAPEQMTSELDRLGLVTWGVARTLNLGYTPAVFVTEGLKDLRLVAQHLGVPPGCVFLFDDKSVSHAELVRDPLPYSVEHMLPVQPFNCATIPRMYAARLQCLLETHFPLEGLRERDFPLFKEAALDPSWPAECTSLSPGGKWIVDKPAIAIAREPWDISRVFSRKSSPLANALLRRLRVEKTRTS
jgi:hypothetical protein